MGSETENKVTIVGVCHQITNTFVEKGWLEPVEGCSNTYRPTPQGRKELGSMFEDHHHWNGADVECHHCGNLWTAVFDSDTGTLECPRCHVVNVLPPNLNVKGPTILWRPKIVTEDAQ